MFNYMYEPKSSSSGLHVTAVQFTKNQYAESTSLQAITIFNNARHIHHNLADDESGSTIQNDTQKLITSAEIFIRYVISILDD